VPTDPGPTGRTCGIEELRNQPSPARGADPSKQALVGVERSAAMKTLPAFVALSPPSGRDSPPSDALTRDRGAGKVVVVTRNVPEGVFAWDEADRMFTLLVKRAAELAECKPGSPEEEEFDRLVGVIDGYEAKRWPDGSLRRRRRPG
jgi:hypothetical protein